LKYLFQRAPIRHQPNRVRQDSALVGRRIPMCLPASSDGRIRARASLATPHGRQTIRWQLLPTLADKLLFAFSPSLKEYSEPGLLSYSIVPNGTRRMHLGGSPETRFEEQLRAQPNLPYHPLAPLK
jgi:hypothetical protein